MRAADRSLPHSERVDFDGRFLHHPLNHHLAVIDMDKQVVGVLNPTAAALWTILGDGGGTEETLAGLLAEAFSVPLSRTRIDVAACLDEWKKAGWLDAAGSSDGWRRAGSRATPRETEGLIYAGDDERFPAMDAPPVRVRPMATWVSLAIGESPHPLCGELAPRLRAMLDGLPRTVTPEDTSLCQTRLFVDQDRVWVETPDGLVWSRDPIEALSHFLSNLITLAHPQARPVATLHAAALSPPKEHGDASGPILMPGLSGRGKSTLAGYLAARGWAYAGDDMIGLGEEEEAGEVWTPVVLPLPTALSIKSGSWPVLAPFFPDLPRRPIISYSGKRARFEPVPPHRLMGGTASERRARAIIFPRHTPNTTAGLIPLSPSETLVELLEAGIATDVHVDPDRLSRLFHALHALPAYRLSHDTLEEAERCLRTLSATPV